MSATNRGTIRLLRDEYPTPEWVTWALVPYIRWYHVHSFLEPCKGNGAILHAIPKVKRVVWREIIEGKDYFTYRPRSQFDLIITNPPYSLAREFLEKSLGEAKTVAYLLRLNYMGSIERAGLWEEHPPDYQFTLYPRPSFTGGGTDATEYAWFIWDKGDLVVQGNSPIKSITYDDPGWKAGLRRRKRS